jgi:hypothetical protein
LYLSNLTARSVATYPGQSDRAATLKGQNVQMTTLAFDFFKEGPNLVVVRQVASDGDSPTSGFCRFSGHFMNRAWHWNASR